MLAAIPPRIAAPRGMPAPTPILASVLKLVDVVGEGRLTLDLFVALVMGESVMPGLRDKVVVEEIF